MTNNTSGAAELEAIVAAEPVYADDHFVLCLFIIGITSLSGRATVNIRRICEEYLAGRHELEIVDISQQPMSVKGEQIIAAPMLIKKLPLPRRYFIGDMSQTEKLLIGLGLPEAAAKTCLTK
jgi:circadian clock protein KaiB